MMFSLMIITINESDSDYIHNSNNIDNDYNRFIESNDIYS